MLALAGYPTTRRGGGQGLVCFDDVPPELILLKLKGHHFFVVLRPEVSATTQQKDKEMFSLPSFSKPAFQVGLLPISQR